MGLAFASWMGSRVPENGQLRLRVAAVFLIRPCWDIKARPERVMLSRRRPVVHDLAKAINQRADGDACDSVDGGADLPSQAPPDQRGNHGGLRKPAHAPPVAVTAPGVQL